MYATQYAQTSDPHIISFRSSYKVLALEIARSSKLVTRVQLLTLEWNFFFFSEREVSVLFYGLTFSGLPDVSEG